MKICILPPVGGTFTKYDDEQKGNLNFVLRAILENIRKKGGLDGVEVEVERGYPVEVPQLERDEEFFATRSVGILKRLREICSKSRYDGILCNSSIDPGVFAGQLVSNYYKIPVVFAMQAAVHMASLIGERFSIIDLTDAMAQIDRRKVESYGLGHRLVSVRAIGINDTETERLCHDFTVGRNAAGYQKVINAMVTQGISAVEKERADTLLLACPVIQPFENEVRKGLDEAGYGEIQLIAEVSAGLEMLKAMVNMKILPAPRAFSGDHLKAKPEYR
jgi:Asp/Glu/hydantoin racemase